MNAAEFSRYAELALLWAVSVFVASSLAYNRGWYTGFMARDESARELDKWFQQTIKSLQSNASDPAKKSG